MKVIFLDIDGVLNNDRTNAKTPTGFIGIGCSLLDRLSTIVKSTNAFIVLSSTWKDEWDLNPFKCTEDGLYLQKKLKQGKMFILDKITDTEEGFCCRGAAIDRYLKQHPDIENYLILDDNDFEFERYKNLCKHWVKIDAATGLTNTDMQKAIEILNN